MPGTPETILAFDFGLRRIGVAVGQQVTNSASPLETVRNDEDGPDWARLRALIGEWRPDRLVVGMPHHEDGSPSETSQHVTAFIGDLEQFGLPIVAVDERYSSIEAEAQLKAARAEGLRGRIDKRAIDSAAAMLIAERWLKNQHQ